MTAFTRENRALDEADRAAYFATCEELSRRIEAALRRNPGVEIKSPWDVLDLPGFDCSDLEPTYAQAAFALLEARRRMVLR